MSRELRKRVAALNAAINPAGSLSARLAILTPDQHASYRLWRDHLDQWHRDHPGSGAYERMLDGDEGPHLRSDVQDALFGPTITIPADASDADAAQIYQRFLEGD